MDGLSPCKEKEGWIMFIVRGIDEKYYSQRQLHDYPLSEAKQKRLKRLEKKMIRLVIKNGGLKVGGSTPLCPDCLNGFYIHWGRWERKVRYFLGKVRKCKIVRLFCKICGRSFSILPDFVNELRRYAKKALHDMVDMKLWFGNGLRKVAGWARIHGCSHTLVWNELQKLGKLCKEGLVRLASICVFSGYLSVDEVWVRRRKGKFVYVFTAIDAVYGYVIWVNSFVVNRKDEKKEAAKQFLTEVKTLGFNPKMVITDEDSCYLEPIAKVFPDAKHQFCIVHVKKNIRKAFKPKKHTKLSKELEELQNMILAIFDVRTTKDEAISFLETGLTAALKLRAPIRVVKSLKNLLSKTDALFHYLDFPSDAPNTNNFSESLYSFFEPFQSMGRNFPSKDSVDNICAAATMHYNFTPKMDSVFEEPVPIRRAARRRLQQNLYKFVKYCC